MSNSIFSDIYFNALIAEHGYNPVDFQRFDFDLGELPLRILEQRFLCHHNADHFSRAVREGQKAIVTTGFGLSGVPHLGTISEMLKVIDLQQAGLKTQVVLGDLDAYNARNQSLATVRERSDVYKQFVLRLGYSEERGIIRDQYSHPDVIRTAFVIGKYLTDQDFLEAEEDLAPLYKEKGIYAEFSFPMKLALLLMLADFLHLHLVEGYRHVLVTLGIEEHKYVLLARKVIERMGIPLELSAMYGKIIGGLNGYPKMSKSIKGSGITVETTTAEIFQLLASNVARENQNGKNIVLELIEQVSILNQFDVEDAQNKFRHGSDFDRESVVSLYANHLVKIVSCWCENGN